MTSDRIARGFSEMADAYVDITPQARRLVTLAAPAVGSRVLDVGCGPGTATVLLAEAVGAEGTVVAIDLAEGMLRRAATTCSSLAGVSVWPMDARALAFRAGAFDLVVASSVLQFTGPRSLAEWKRVVRAGGRVACSIPTGFEGWTELCLRYVAHTPEPYRSTVAAQLQAASTRPDAAAVRDRLGFASAAVDVEPLAQAFPSPEEAWASLRAQGARVFIEALPEDVLPAFRDELLAAVRTAGGGGELRSEMHHWCFTA